MMRQHKICENKTKQKMTTTKEFRKNQKLD
jgi:hypothetical protein